MNKKILFLSLLVSCFALSASALVSIKTIRIGTKGSNIYFNKGTLSARHGEKIRLIFTNNAEKGSGLQHDWVLVKPGTDNTVAQAAIEAGPETGYVPHSPDVLAHTKLINPGDQTTITFTAPNAPGSYPYICTFPGHAVTMKGTLQVK